MSPSSSFPGCLEATHDELEIGHTVLVSHGALTISALLPSNYRSQPGVSGKIKRQGSTISLWDTPPPAPLPGCPQEAATLGIWLVMPEAVPA